MREVLEHTQKEAEHTRVRVHTNPDGTIDGELRMAIPRGVTASEALINLELSLPSIRQYWVSVGVIMSFREKEGDEIRQRYDRFHGLRGAFTHPQRSFDYINESGVFERGRTGYNFVTARDIADNIDSAGHLKPTEIVLRLRWDQDGRRPNWG